MGSEDDPNEQSTDDTKRTDPDHGAPDESGTRFWCGGCKLYVPEFNWDFHERYHDPERQNEGWSP